MPSETYAIRITKDGRLRGWLATVDPYSDEMTLSREITTSRLGERRQAFMVCRNHLWPKGIESIPEQLSDDELRMRALRMEALR